MEGALELDYAQPPTRRERARVLLRPLGWLTMLAVAAAFAAPYFKQAKARLDQSGSRQALAGELPESHRPVRHDRIRRDDGRSADPAGRHAATDNDAARSRRTTTAPTSTRVAVSVPAAGLPAVMRPTLAVGRTRFSGHANVRPSPRGAGGD